MVDSTRISADIRARTIAKKASGDSTAFLIFDTETVPDGTLIRRVKYPDDDLTDREAIERAREEARELSPTDSDFLPVTFQLPVAVCVLRVGNDFTLRSIACLDAPQYRPEEMVRSFWKGVEFYKAKLVTFNGRGFDLPLLELAAYRYGCSAPDYFANSRNRFGGRHIDLCDWLANFGASRMTGGLNLLAKLVGKPGKLDVAGDQVLQLFDEGRLREINDYCMFDTLDTYFVFLRTRILLGELNLELEKVLVHRAKSWIASKIAEYPALQHYLDNWQETPLPFVAG